MRLAALALALLTGCAGAPSPGSTAPGAKRLSPAEAQRAKALKSAADYCKRNGLVLQSSRSAVTPARPARGVSGELPFRCVKGKEAPGRGPSAPTAAR